MFVEFGRTLDDTFKARITKSKHTKKGVKYILKTLIRYGSPIIAADPNNTFFEEAKLCYEVVYRELSEAGLPSPKILARILLDYFQTGGGTCCHQLCKMGYSYSYVKNRLPYLARLGLVERARYRPCFYYPNVSLLTMRVFNQWSFRNSDNFKGSFHEFLEQLCVKDGCIGLHNLHLSFYALGIYNHLTADMEKCGWRFECSNKEFITPEILFGPDRSIKAIFEANGRVRVIIACGNNPFIIPDEIVPDFTELLTAFWKLLRRNLEALMHIRFDPVILPKPRTWIINSVEINADFDSYGQRVLGPLGPPWKINKAYIREVKSNRKMLRIETLLKPNVTVSEFVDIVRDSQSLFK